MEGMDEIEGFDEYGNEAEAPSAGGSDSKKDRYTAIIPESFLKSAMSMEEDGAYMVTGAAEESVFREIVKRAKEAGYTNDAMETDRGGILIYGASDDHNEALNVTCSAGYVTVIFSE